MKLEKVESLTPPFVLFRNFQRTLYQFPACPFWNCAHIFGYKLLGFSVGCVSQRRKGTRLLQIFSRYVREQQSQIGNISRCAQARIAISIMSDLQSTTNDVLCSNSIGAESVLRPRRAGLYTDRIYLVWFFVLFVSVFWPLCVDGWILN